MKVIAVAILVSLSVLSRANRPKVSSESKGHTTGRSKWKIQNKKWNEDGTYATPLNSAITKTNSRSESCRFYFSSSRAQYIRNRFFLRNISSPTIFASRPINYSYKLDESRTPIIMELTGNSFLITRRSTSLIPTGIRNSNGTLSLWSLKSAITGTTTINKLIVSFRSRISVNSADSISSAEPDPTLLREENGVLRNSILFDTTASLKQPSFGSQQSTWSHTRRLLKLSTNSLAMAQTYTTRLPTYPISSLEVSEIKPTSLSVFSIEMHSTRNVLSYTTTPFQITSSHTTGQSQTLEKLLKFVTSHIITPGIYPLSLLKTTATHTLRLTKSSITPLNTNLSTTTFLPTSSTPSKIATTSLITSDEQTAPYTILRSTNSFPAVISSHTANLSICQLTSPASSSPDTRILQSSTISSHGTMSSYVISLLTSFQSSFTVIATQTIRLKGRSISSLETVSTDTIGTLTVSITLLESMTSTFVSLQKTSTSILRTIASRTYGVATFSIMSIKSVTPGTITLPKSSVVSYNTSSQHTTFLLSSTSSALSSRTISLPAWSTEDSVTVMSSLHISPPRPYTSSPNTGSSHAFSIPVSSFAESLAPESISRLRSTVSLPGSVSPGSIDVPTTSINKTTAHSSSIISIQIPLSWLSKTTSLSSIILPSPSISSLKTTALQIASLPSSSIGFSITTSSVTAIQSISSMGPRETIAFTSSSKTTPTASISLSRSFIGLPETIASHISSLPKSSIALYETVLSATISLSRSSLEPTSYIAFYTTRLPLSSIVSYETASSNISLPRSSLGSPETKTYYVSSLPQSPMGSYKAQSTDSIISSIVIELRGSSVDSSESIEHQISSYFPKSSMHSSKPTPSGIISLPISSLNSSSTTPPHVISQSSSSVSVLLSNTAILSKIVITISSKAINVTSGSTPQSLTSTLKDITTSHSTMCVIHSMRSSETPGTHTVMHPTATSSTIRELMSSSTLDKTIRSSALRVPNTSTVLHRTVSLSITARNTTVTNTITTLKTSISSLKRKELHSITNLPSMTSMSSRFHSTTIFSGRSDSYRRKELPNTTHMQEATAGLTAGRESILTTSVQATSSPVITSISKESHSSQRIKLPYTSISTQRAIPRITSVANSHVTTNLLSTSRAARVRTGSPNNTFFVNVTTSRIAAYGYTTSISSEQRVVSSTNTGMFVIQTLVYNKSVPDHSSAHIYSIVPTPVPKLHVKKLVVRARISIMEAFSDKLNNKSSLVYKRKESAAKRTLTKVYERIPGFIKVSILGFKNGSTIINYNVVFHNNKHPSKTSLGKQIANVTKVAISGGNLGDFKVKKGSFTIDAIVELNLDDHSSKWPLHLGIAVLVTLVVVCTVVAIYKGKRRRGASVTPINESESESQTSLKYIRMKSNRVQPETTMDTNGNGDSCYQQGSAVNQTPAKVPKIAWRSPEENNRGQGAYNIHGELEASFTADLM